MVDEKPKKKSKMAQLTMQDTSVECVSEPREAQMFCTSNFDEPEPVEEVKKIIEETKEETKKEEVVA